jgi:hypothetical protein
MATMQVHCIECDGKKVIKLGTANIAYTNNALGMKGNLFF